MNSKITVWIGVGIVVAVGVAVVLAVQGLRARPPESWTDGAAIRVPTAGAPVREILWQPAEPLPGKAGGVGGVGGSTDEYEPRYSADGTTLVFVRGRPGQNAELFTAKRTAGGWGEPTPIASVNTEHDELGPELSLDGTSLYFYSDRPGGLGGYDLWVSRAKGDGWGEAVGLGGNVNSAWNEYGPALSPDGARLYFSSNRPRAGEPATSPESWNATVREYRTRHDYDLYSADLRDGSSGNAEAAAALNTAADEGAPAMSPAGDFLYFASDREGGLGGFDLYQARVAVKDALGKDGFGKPEGLGAAVNSLANDLDPALTADGFRLCFSSDRLREGTAAETRAQTVTPRYSLWSSVSREVYRSADAAAKTERWNLLPWLLLLLLTLLPLFLLMRLMGSEVWRRRLGQMGLVARCLMVSLLIHACLASLFAVWKIGSGIIDVMQQGGGGGTRVVLASGTPGGSVAGQIRGFSTGAVMAVPELSSMAADVSIGTVDAPAVTVAMPELVAVPAAMVTVEDRKGAEPLAPVAARSVELAAANVSDATIPAAVRPEGAVAEPVAAATNVDVTSGSPQAAPAASQGAVEAFVPKMDAVAVPTAGTLRVEAAPDRVPGTVGGSSPTAVPVAAEVAVGGGAESRVPTAKGGGVPQKEAGTPSAAGMVGVEGAGPSAPVAASKAGTGGGRVDVNVAAMNGAGDGAGVVVETPSAGGGAVKQMGPTGDARAVLAPGASSGVEAGIPKVATASGAGGSPAGEASLPKSSGASGPSFVDAPVAPGASGSTGAGTVIVDPRSGTGGAGAEVPLSIGDATPGAGRGNGPSGFEPSAARGLGNGLAAYLPSGGAGELDSRLPATPPTPVEKFEQRAPEVRSELVEKMGGSAETEKAVGLALDWFARHQAKDGSWSAEHFDDGCGACDGKAEVKADAAMTGMVLLCYLGAGHTHVDEGPFREVVGRALAWLVARQTADGDLRGGETMYGQTVSTVALCEALAMTQDPGLTRPAQRAVSFVLARAAGDQRREGGKADRDTSVLGWLVFTVESARRAGIDVPKSTFDAAGKWLEFVTVPGMPGRYTYAKGKPASAAMTAEAMFVQQILGRKRDERVMDQSAKFILGTLPKWGDGAPTYYWYYATLALFQHQGESWKSWNAALVRELLANQKSEGKMAGSWEPTDEWSRLGGRVYQTAVCTLSLEVYYRYRAEGVKAGPAR